MTAYDEASRTWLDRDSRLNSNEYLNVDGSRRTSVTNSNRGYYVVTLQ
jgi:hypothetical protein